jgi:hypothetical protein
MKNGKQIEWEARLERLEADVKEIKSMLQAQQPKEPWWKAVVGTFEGDPVFEEISRLGAEIREKERQKARRRGTKAKPHA